ncbi:MAG TPA: nuclear transport factor 2 family protein [Gemmataceae bacterium]|nr:nuclear transport factor 2 family protein [Gemmataceae bacterium]
MATVDLLALVRKLDDALAGGDLNAVREQVAAGAEWILPGRHPLAGRKRGPEEVVAYHRLLNKGGVRLEPVSLDAIDAETVVKIQHATGTAPGGVGLDSMELLVYRIEAGKVSRVETFLGDQHPVDLFYWAAFRLKPIPDCLSE